MPREIILLKGQNDVWPYRFVGDDSGGCGKVTMPSGAVVDDVQAAVVTPLADLARTLHGCEIDVTWSVLTPDSWVGEVAPRQ
ncbi:hypothetical protein GCM10010425_22240 [Streptomyces spororaveus]